jgi:hypothetical protein
MRSGGRCAGCRGVQERALPKKEGATLWECEEVTLRFLLEDGKMMLLLRLLDSYLSVCEAAERDREGGKVRGAWFPGAALTSSAATSAAGKFEWGMGQTLWNAWAHDEGIQVMDLALLWSCVARGLRRWRGAAGGSTETTALRVSVEVGAVSSVGEGGGSFPSAGSGAVDDSDVGTRPDVTRSLAVAALRWADQIGAGIRRLDGDRVLAEAVRSGALIEIALFCTVAAKASPATLDRATVLTGCRALARIFSAEGWEGMETRAFGTAGPAGGPTLGAALVALDDAILKEATKLGASSDGAEWRNALRAAKTAANNARREGFLAASPPPSSVLTA